MSDTANIDSPGSTWFDPRRLDAAFYADPYGTYARLREESPLYRCPDGSIFLTRHADLVHVYKHAGAFCSDKRLQFAPAFGVDSPLYEHHTTSLVFNDPPLHTHVRKAIGNALSPKAVAAMQTGLESVVERLLDRIADLGRFDLVADFATAIPIEIIGNLLRVPAEERAPLRGWSLAILGGLEFGLSAEAMARGNAAVTEMLTWLEDFVSRRRNSLSDDEDDIIARLIRWEADGYRLTTKALCHQCIFLLNAGHETTSNLIGNGVYLLIQNPREMSRLRAEPALIDAAVEEMLRCESPNQLGNRTVVRDTEISGVPLRAGTTLTLCIGAANRDPAVFAEAERFDIGRNPNPHLAFGAGIHTCAGLNVARLEAKIAINRLVQRFPKLAIDAQPMRARRARFRGFESLPMKT